MPILVRRALALACVSALPLYAQYPPSTTEKTTARPVAKRSESTTTEKTATPTKTPTKTMRRATNVSSDVTRLAAILLDSQNQKVTISAEAWQKTANEANSLANRIAASSGGKAARELRTHVHEMHSAAMSGDANGARDHAGLALPFAYQLSGAR